MSKQKLSVERQEYLKRLRKKFSSSFSKEEIETIRKKGEERMKERMEQIRAITDMAVDFPEPSRNPDGLKNES